MELGQLKLRLMKNTNFPNQKTRKFQILKETKDKKDAEFNERLKHRTPKALDEDETEFLDTLELKWFLFMPSKWMCLPAEKLSQIISNSFLRDGTTVGTFSIGKFAFGSA